MSSPKRQPELHDVTIESMSHEGRGIARINGKTVFVFGALDGERVRIRIRQRRRKFDQAETVEVLEAAPQRVEPLCAAYRMCGGCSLQHLGADDQVAFKQGMLLEMFEHAGIEYDEVLPPLRGPAWGYRSKARLGVKYVPKKQRVLVGFRERNSPFIADMTRCEVLLPQVGHRLQRIGGMIDRLEARARIPQIEVAADAQHVQLVFRHLDPLSSRDLDILTDFARTSGYQVQLQPGGPDTVRPLYPERQRLELEPLANSPLRIAFGALDFIQVNRDINQQMVARVLQLLDLEPSHRVLDLFCGLGNFTLPLAQACAGVTGIEGEAAMVERARDSARDNGLDNTDYHVADLSQPDRGQPWMGRRYDRVLLDPPRSGAQEMARLLPDFGARRVVYVSCQPSSLVRDAAIICGQGYRMTHVGVMDMFPQTAHVESIAVFTAT